jgi:ABC-type amino acid transport substrate-binding protein
MFAVFKIMCIPSLAALLIGCGTGTNSANSAVSKSDTGAVANKPVELDIAEKARLWNGKTIVRLHSSVSESQLEAIWASRYGKVVPGFQAKVVYVDSLTDGLLMLRSHKADFMSLMSYTADYLARRNPDLQVYTGPVWQAGTQLAFAKAKITQFEQVNDALKAMLKDGKMDDLVVRWITNLPEGAEPSAEPMPVISGAGSIRVGISGDAPPLDYIAPDGKPSGFNVALLAELSRRARLNIELVTVNAGARFTALQSGRIDAFLWETNETSASGEPTNTKEWTAKNRPATLLFTETYLAGASSILALK